MLYFNWNHSFIVPVRESCQRSDKGIVMIDNSLEQVSHLTHAGKSSCISSICGHYEDKRSIKKGNVLGLRLNSELLYKDQLDPHYDITVICIYRPVFLHGSHTAQKRNV